MYAVHINKIYPKIIKINELTTFQKEIFNILKLNEAFWHSLIIQIHYILSNK